MQHSQHLSQHKPRVLSKRVRTDAPAIQLCLSIYDPGLLDGSASIEQIARYFDERTAPGPATLVRALHQCERGDIHDASHDFFASLSARDQWFEIEFLDDITCWTVHIRERDVLALSEADKTAAAFAFLDGQCSRLLEGRGGLMLDNGLPPIVEALGLAVVRSLCIQGHVERAHTLTQKLLTVTRRSIYLRSAESAIGLLLKQEPVPPHLEKFVGLDPGTLMERFCPVPFARVDVHQGGEVAMCCTHWLPTNIGNVFDDAADNILNSATAKDIRRSVVDGSFKYCSHTDCEVIANDKLPFKRDYADKAFDDDYYHINQQLLSDAFALKTFEIPNVSYLLFCLDRSCNLSCPSCRVDVIMVKGEERDKLYEATERAVLPMLRNAQRVMVNPSGEAFLSRPSRRLLESLAEPGYESLTVDIITNATLCDKAEWDKFSHLYRRIGYIRVSIDGASKAVIEKLRRGTKFEPLMENLANLARMHKEGLFVNFFMSFTYQRDNLFEMEEFLRFGSSFGASAIIFERLQNVGAFTPDEYQDRAVHLVDHPMHNDFIRIARRVKQDPKVLIDFDPGLATH